MHFVDDLAHTGPRVQLSYRTFVALGGLHVEDNVQAVQEYHDIKENNQQPSVQLEIYKKNELMHE